MKASTRFVASCYRYRTEPESMSQVRQRVWSSKVGKSAAAPKLTLCSAPTTEAFTENVKRVQLQTCLWKKTLEPNPPQLDPTLFRRKKITKTRSLARVMLPTNTSEAPPEILQMIRCGCESQQLCLTGRCRCTNARLSCTIFCGCMGSVVCNNPQTKQN